MSTNTATIETLTAEVRVLMVGSRQVTMSVFKQLDWLTPSALTPFGRVSTGRKATDDFTPGIELVGVDESGNLVRSEIWPPNWTKAAPAAFNHWQIHQQVAYQNPVNVTEKFNGHQLRWRHWSGEQVEGLCVHPVHPDIGTPPWKQTDLERWLSAEYRHRRRLGEFCDVVALHDNWLDKCDDDYRVLRSDQELYDQMAALPLIVLAGLR
jgi:hypothetical protein